MSKSQQPLSQPATWTEEWRRECEAREWMSRYRQKRGSAEAWWRETNEAIRKARGQAGLDTLIADMNRQKNERPIQN
jgi:hypothetical protein